MNDGDATPQPTQRHDFPKSMSQLTALTYVDLSSSGLDQIPAFVTAYSPKGAAGCLERKSSESAAFAPIFPSCKR